MPAISFYADTTKGDRLSSQEFVPDESSGEGFSVPETFQADDSFIEADSLVNDLL